MIDVVYLISKEKIESLPSLVRSAMQIPSRNSRAGSEEQERDSANWGGRYWLFDFFGIKVRLIPNDGEARIDEMPDAVAYAFVEAASADLTTQFTLHLAAELQAAGVQTATGTLA